MEEAWIDRLPQDVLQRVIPLETPRDACRAAAVSQAFRAVADSDVVWGKFQPDDSSLQLADGELFPPPRSKKERFLASPPAYSSFQIGSGCILICFVDPFSSSKLQLSLRRFTPVLWRRACGWTGGPGPGAICSRPERW